MLAILLFLWGIGKEQETWLGVLKGQIWRTDTAHSQHRLGEGESRYRRVGLQDEVHDCTVE